MLVNMSVWRDLDALSGYVFKSAHVEVMRNRREWFHRLDEAYTVLWWVPVGHIPTVAEALERLDHLRLHGPSAHAFTFAKNFPALQD